MIRYEWKKLLFKRRGLGLIAAFLAAQAVLLLFVRPYDEVLERNRTVYESYLTQVEGPLTAQKRAWLEAEMERLDSVHQELEQLKMDYYSGDISEEDYRSGFDRLQPEDAKYTGFSKLYSQYIYVRESADRSFLYTGGWETLLTDWEPDYLMLMLLILLLTPIFCEEYACNMDDILRTQKHSARHHVGAKLAVALCLTGALTAVVQMMAGLLCFTIRTSPWGFLAAIGHEPRRLPLEADSMAGILGAVRIEGAGIPVRCRSDSLPLGVAEKILPDFDGLCGSDAPAAADHGGS